MTLDVTFSFKNELIHKVSSPREKRLNWRLCSLHRGKWTFFFADILGCVASLHVRWQMTGLGFQGADHWYAQKNPLVACSNTFHFPLSKSAAATALHQTAHFRDSEYWCGDRHSLFDVFPLKSLSVTLLCIEPSQVAAAISKQARSITRLIPPRG